MSRVHRILSALAVLTFVGPGCSGLVNPVTVDHAGIASPASKVAGSQTHLWGYWDVMIDTQTLHVQTSANRHAMFTANVTGFLNNAPLSMTFKINKVTNGPDYTDIDIDVGLTHPFPGMPQYNGYDVRGVFMGDGSKAMAYNSDLIFPVFGTDQYMFPNPEGGNGGPDGYTRWFNKTEFSTGGMPMFQYIKGKLASASFNGTATLCPYRYYADGLGANDDLWTWLTGNAATHGVFSSGKKNTRNYYLRFPAAKNIVYGYAVIANWQGVSQADHPSNAVEAVGCKIEDNSSVYYVNPSIKGGNLTLGISVFDWHSQLSAGVMEDYNIYVESPVLPSPYKLSPSEMTPIGGNEVFSTYFTDIPASPNQSGIIRDNWVIVEYPGHDYTNDFGVTNLAGTDPLAAFFRFDLVVADQEPEKIVVVSPNGGEVWTGKSLQNITWSAPSSVQYVDILYSKDDFSSDFHDIAAHVPNTGSWQWKVANDPSDTVKVMVRKSGGGLFDTSDDYFSILKGPCEFGTESWSTPTRYTISNQVFGIGGIWVTRQDPVQRIITQSSPLVDNIRSILVYNASSPEAGPVASYDTGAQIYNNSGSGVYVDSYSIKGIDRIFYTSGAGVNQNFHFIDWNGSSFVNQQNLEKPDSYGIWDICFTPEGDLYLFTSYGVSPALYFYDKSENYKKTYLFNLSPSAFDFGSVGNFRDMVWSPVLNAIVILVQNNNVSPGRQLYALTPSGEVIFKDLDVFGTSSNFPTILAGMNIDLDDPDCRIVTYAVNSGSRYFVRYSGDLTEKKVLKQAWSDPDSYGNTYGFCRGDIQDDGTLWAALAYPLWYSIFYKFSPPPDW